MKIRSCSTNICKSSSSNIRVTYSIYPLLARIVVIALLLLPFNDLPYFPGVLGELSGEGAVYPLLLAALLFVPLFFVGRVQRPKHISFSFLLGFIGWAAVSGLFNINIISENLTKGRGGVEKFTLQFALLIFVSLCSVLVYSVASRQWGSKALMVFRKWVLLGFLLVGAYCLVEIARLVEMSWAVSILQVIDPLLHDEPYFGRLRSVSGEASWLGVYLAFAFPWLLSYMFTAEKQKFWYIVIVIFALLIAIFTYSRYIYFTILLQIVAYIFMVFTLRRKIARKSLLYIFGSAITILMVIVVVVFWSPPSAMSLERIVSVFTSLARISEDNPYYLSNVARVGSQVAACAMAFNHPIFGIGLGQYGFLMPEYVPGWALMSDEIQKWMSPLPGTAWPPVHGLYARIAAETGMVGLIFWLATWGTMLISTWRRCRKVFLLNREQGMLGVALIISKVGVLLAGLNLDSFRVFSYWFLLALGWLYVDHKFEAAASRCYRGYRSCK